MHYDIENGTTETKGFFSKITVILLSLFLVFFGIYMLINWFAPEIFFYVSDHRQTIENITKTQPVEKDTLRIPALNIEHEIVPKNANGKVQISNQNSYLVLSGTAHKLGITPFETKNLSTLALLYRAETDMNIYLDLDNERTVYKVTEVLKNTHPILNSTNDLVIYALDDSGETAVTEIRAQKLGEVKH